MTVDMADAAKKLLNARAKRVHGALRTLKMGETGYITCDKDHPSEEVIQYVRAYAFHKEKWFDTSYDKTTKVITVVRSSPAPWPEESEHDDEEVP